MIRAAFRSFPIRAMFTNPYRIIAIFMTTEISVGSGGIEGQLIDNETGALLYDSVTGAPLVW